MAAVLAEDWAFEPETRDAVAESLLRAAEWGAAAEARGRQQAEQAMSSRVMAKVTANLTEDNQKLRAQVAALTQALKAARATLHDIASNFDHDSDAHRYNTTCRECAATKAVEAIDAALTGAQV